MLNRRIFVESIAALFGGAKVAASAPLPAVAAPAIPPAFAVPVSSARKVVILSPAQQEAARICWPDISVREAYVKYARNLLEHQQWLDEEDIPDA